MNCERCREVVSAGLDREAGAAEARAAEAHLDECARCRGWVERAAAITRRARTRPADEGPDLVDDVLHALDHGWPARADPAAGAPPMREPGGGRRLVLLASDEPGNAACGCLATCGCGCQQGLPCRCGHGRAA